MKKIGKKLSFLTKIMLVIGLLISNLSTLSVVFAYEVPDDVVITKEEDKLKIEYTGELAEDVKKVNVYVYESYTYLDGKTDKIESVEPYKLDEAQIESIKLGENELELTHTKSTFKLFDGTYEAVVKFYKVVEVMPEIEVSSELETSSEVVGELESLEIETPEVTEVLITTDTYTEEVTYDRGLKVRVYGDDELSLNDGRYSVPAGTSEVSIGAYVLTGGLAPSDTFMHNEVSYTAEELVGKEFPYNYEFTGKLYGEYEETISLELLKLVTPSETEVVETDVEPEYENVTYSTDVKFMYGTYADNADVLNTVNTMTDTYYFDGNTKDGVLYNFMNLTTGTVGTMLDLYTILKNATDGTEIEYKLFKGNLDLIQEYNNIYGNQVAPVSEGEEVTLPTVTIEEYLEEVTVDGTVKVTLTSGEETISYKLVVLGDVNGDNLVDETDVDALIELIVADETDNDKADVDGLDGVNSKDILYLKKVIENKDWNVTVLEETVTLDTELNTNLTAEDTLVSGDTFEVDYTLKLSTDEVSGFSGKVEYDKESLELVSVESLIEGIGSYDKETGKFFYLGNESLELPEVQTPEVEETPENSEVMTYALLTRSTTTPTVVTADHVVLKLTFRALKSGTHNVKITDTEYFNSNTYLDAGDLESTVTVETEKSDDNTLSYLEIAGNEIELVDGVFEYELTVKNEVTLVDLKYILSNIAASVTSTVVPNELDEGTNEIVISVVSESGLTQDYKVVVTREEAVKETTTTQVNYNNYEPNYQRPEEEEPVTPVEPVEPKEEPKESNLSKIIIMALIVLVIGGLVYLIFKDDEDEPKSVNKKLNKLKKADADFEVKTDKNTKEVKGNNKKKPDKKKSNNKKGNNRKER